MPSLYALQGPEREVRAPLVPLRPKAPLHIVAMDYLKLSRPTDRFQNILMVTDLFTKYAWAIPTLDQTATTTVNALWRTVFQLFGCPETLRWRASESYRLGESSSPAAPRGLPTSHGSNR